MSSEQYDHLVNSGLNGCYHRFSHTKLEHGFSKDDFFERVLEIGAGRGEHLRFVKHQFKEYWMTDKTIKKDSIYLNVENIIIERQDVEKLTFKDASFDRTIVTCVLHHIDKPLHAIEELKRIMKIDGVLDILLPHDPGLLFRFSRFIFSDRHLRKTEAPLPIIRAVEHRNHYLSIREMIRYSFREHLIVEKRYPLPYFPYEFNLFSTFRITRRESRG